MWTGQTTNGHWCGLFCATDPDEGRTRGTHSLAGNLAALELIGHTPRRSKPDSSTLAPCGGGILLVVLSGFLSCAVARSGRQPEGLAPAELRPAQAGVLGSGGDHGFSVGDDAPGAIRRTTRPNASETRAPSGGRRNRRECR